MCTRARPRGADGGDLPFFHAVDPPAGPFTSPLLVDRQTFPSPLRENYQNRNIHGNIFGGFLMRQAFELAHVTCGTIASSTVPLRKSLTSTHCRSLHRLDARFSLHGRCLIPSSRAHRYTSHSPSCGTADLSFPLLAGSVLKLEGQVVYTATDALDSRADEVSNSTQVTKVLRLLWQRCSYPFIRSRLSTRSCRSGYRQTSATLTLSLLLAMCSISTLHVLATDDTSSPMLIRVLPLSHQSFLLRSV